MIMQQRKQPAACALTLKQHLRQIAAEKNPDYDYSRNLSYPRTSLFEDSQRPELRT
jgi:hypothetical protein